MVFDPKRASRVGAKQIRQRNDERFAKDYLRNFDIEEVDLEINQEKYEDDSE